MLRKSRIVQVPQSLRMLIGRRVNAIIVVEDFFNFCPREL